MLHNPLRETLAARFLYLADRDLVLQQNPEGRFERTGNVVWDGVRSPFCERLMKCKGSDYVQVP
jgi:hypothetical protein